MISIGSIGRSKWFGKDSGARESLGADLYHAGSNNLVNHCFLLGIEQQASKPRCKRFWLKKPEKSRETNFYLCRLHITTPQTCCDPLLANWAQCMIQRMFSGQSGASIQRTGWNWPVKTSSTGVNIVPRVMLFRENYGNEVAQGLLTSSAFFLGRCFPLPFRLFLAPNTCPWASPPRMKSTSVTLILYCFVFEF